MPKRALVTGAAGYVGAVLARGLIEDGHDVHVAVRPQSNRWRLDDIDAPVHTVDLADEARVAETLRAVRPEWIFHLAAHGAYSSQTDVPRMIETNLVGTTNLVTAALDLGFDALVNAGSSSEYGFVDHAPGEDERAEPNSAYAWSKLSQTLFCRFTARARDCHIPTLRLYSVYGPYEEPSRFVPSLIVHGLEGRLPPLASPDVARDFVHNDDVVRAFVLAAEHTSAERGAIYNVGSGTQTTLEDAVRLARVSFGIGAEPEWQTMENRTWDTTTWVANTRRIESELGWKPAVSFDDGFGRFADWLRSGRERYRA